MPDSTDVLKSYLINIGFRIEESQFRRFSEVVRSAGKGVVEMGSMAVAATAAMGTSLQVVGKQLEGLYYISQRTGASAAHLKELSYGAEQVGVSAEAATAAVEALASARRNNPGLNGVLESLKIDSRQIDNVNVLNELLVKLYATASNRLTYPSAARTAEMFGISEPTFLMMENNLSDMLKNQADQAKFFSDNGIDPDAMAQRGLDFEKRMKGFGNHVEGLGQVIASRLMPYGDKMLDWLENLNAQLLKADKTTDGLSSKVIGLGAAATSAGLGGFLLKRMFGGGAAKIAAGTTETVLTGEVAGEAGAAAGGLGAVALPAIIVSAVGAALVWMTAHPELVRAAVSKEIKALPGQLGKVGDATAKLELKAEHAVEGFLGPVLAKSAKTFVDGIAALKTAGVTGTLSALGLAGMVAGFEGHAKSGYGTYRDVAGKLTAGFGHLVRQGEDFSNLDEKGALALLAKDLQSAVASVAKLVKVHLSGNQQKALQDFVFNLGEGNLAKSTLLKKLNSGDFAGAADQFQYWNKAVINGHLQVAQGLVSRRAADAALFRTPDKTAPAFAPQTVIHVTGSEAENTGRAVARQQDRVNGDLVRNFVGAIK